MDKYTLEKLNLTIKNIIETWEPRISLLSVPIEHDDTSVTITINYSIPALNNELDSFIFTIQR